MAATPVTVGQFAEFVHDTGYKTDAEKDGWSAVFIGGKKSQRVKGVSWSNPGFEQGDDQAVVCMSWNDSVAFCEWLSKKEGKPYRLPTEAEWEYSARAGTHTAFYFGTDASSLVDYAWARSNSVNQTHAVGQKKPNAWGMYDMIGNAWEWCGDWKGDYAAGEATDPQGPGNGLGRVVRGGSWHDVPRFFRCAKRDKEAPGIAFDNVGFRVVVDSD